MKATLTWQMTWKGWSWDPRERRRSGLRDKDTGVSFEKYEHPTDYLDYLLCDLCEQYME